MTRCAMAGQGFSKDDVDRAVKADVAVDDYPFDNPAHYMPNYGPEAEQLIKDLMERARSAKNTRDREAAMDALGRAMHTMQDKYAHRRQGTGAHAKAAFGAGQSPDDPSGNNRYAYCNAYNATKTAVQQYLAP
jgi:hypothetical protein